MPIPNRSFFRSCRRYRAAWIGLMVLALGTQGCASLTNPVADGVPVRRLPEEFKARSREDLKPIPLTMLRQKPIATHLVGPGDVLGIVIDNVLGEKNQPVPTRIAETGSQTPAIGYPIVVQDNGTILLPYIDPLNVEGKTLLEVQELLRDAYVKKKEIIKPGTERIFVSLLQPRKFHVLVMREDGGTQGTQVAQNNGAFGLVTNSVGASKKGTGFQLDLPIGENDVLNALARSGGLPGTDAKNEVVVHRRATKDGANTIVRIPLRMRPGEVPPFQPEDVILHTGDIVYLESREAEVYYTAGLIGAGLFPLPRDTDLDIVQAIAQVRGPLINGGFSQTSLVANSVNTGLGGPSPSLVTVLRKTANGQQIPIRVDLNLAMSDPRERILVQAGDIIVMQERTSESISRYFSGVFKLNLFGTFIRQQDLSGTSTLGVP